MDRWVTLCPVGEAPPEGAVVEVEAEGAAICLARIGGSLHALDNVCPHRQGPLGEGWIEGEAVVCPWHSWAFDVYSGEALPPERSKVRVFPVRTDGESVQIELS